MGPDVRIRKKVLRSSQLRARRDRTPADRQLAAEAIAAQAATIGLLAGATHVASYLSLASEPGTGALHELLHDRGVTVFVPRALPDRTMQWVDLASGGLSFSDLGVPEPDGPAVDDALRRCQLIFVPALAVDGAGHRLGRGAGYYDRALANTSAVTCAVVFTEELIGEVPHEPHDRRVDLALTPGGVLRTQDTEPAGQ